MGRAKFAVCSSRCTSLGAAHAVEDHPVAPPVTHSDVSMIDDTQCAVAGEDIGALTCRWLWPCDERVAAASSECHGRTYQQAALHGRANQDRAGAAGGMRVGCVARIVTYDMFSDGGQ